MSTDSSRQETVRQQETEYLLASQVKTQVADDGTELAIVPDTNEVITALSFGGEIVLRDDLTIGYGDEATIVLGVRITSVRVTDGYGGDVTNVVYTATVTSVDTVEGEDVVTLDEDRATVGLAAMRRQIDRRVEVATGKALPRQRGWRRFIVRRGDQAA